MMATKNRRNRSMDSNTRSEGVGILGVIFIVLLILKILEVVEISWYWVMAPIWMPLVAYISIVLLGILVGGIVVMFKGTKDGKEDE